MDFSNAPGSMKCRGWLALSRKASRARLTSHSEHSIPSLWHCSSTTLRMIPLTLAALTASTALAEPKTSPAQTAREIGPFVDAQTLLVIRIDIEGIDTDGLLDWFEDVLRKSLELGLRPVVVINKVDRDGARPHWVLDQTFELFDKLGASDEQLDFPVVYASALQGYAGLQDDVREGDMTPLFETILNEVSPPDVDQDGPFQMRITTLDYNTYVGVIGIAQDICGHLEQDIVLFEDVLAQQRDELRRDQVRPDQGRAGPALVDVALLHRLVGAAVAARTRVLAAATASAERKAMCGVSTRFSMSRPTIELIMRSMVNSATGPLVTRLPSRSTATLSDSCITSPRM